jgi:hypothetical protein
MEPEITKTGAVIIAVSDEFIYLQTADNDIITVRR